MSRATASTIKQAAILRLMGRHSYVVQLQDTGAIIQADCSQVVVVTKVDVPDRTAACPAAQSEEGLDFTLAKHLEEKVLLTKEFESKVGALSAKLVPGRCNAEGKDAAGVADQFVQVGLLENEPRGDWDRKTYTLLLTLFISLSLSFFSEPAR